MEDTFQSAVHNLVGGALNSKEGGVGVAVDGVTQEEGVRAEKGEEHVTLRSTPSREEKGKEGGIKTYMFNTMSA